MARGNEIVVSVDPRGRTIEGIITGTPKPGTLMMLEAGVAVDAGGRFSYVPYAPGADGNRLPVIVLLADSMQGKLASDAFVTGSRGQLYFPLPGDEINMLLQDVAGTGDDHAVGDLLIGDNGTGKLIATTGTPENEPFTVLEAITDPVADTLTWCMFNGC